MAARTLAGLRRAPAPANPHGIGPTAARALIALAMAAGRATGLLAAVARLAVMLRRAVPLLSILGLIAATPAVALLPMDQGTLLRMLIFHAPPLMLAAFFMLSELPRIEIPPIPRKLGQDGWLADAT